MQDLGTLGGYSSQANAINNTGQVVGTADLADGSHHAFLWSGGSMRDLGTLGGPNSWAYGINESGLIVGAAQLADNSWHAVLWSGGAIQDLNSLIPAGSGWVLGGAAGVNKAGQICGVGTHNGVQRGFLLTPASRSAKRPR